eukprot:358967-Chlamydomonas_euryale.AAC.1
MCSICARIQRLARGKAGVVARALFLMGRNELFGARRHKPASVGRGSHAAAPCGRPAQHGRREKRQLRRRAGGSSQGGKRLCRRPSAEEDLMGCCVQIPRAPR